MKIYIGADHQGYALRRGLIEYLKKSDYDVHDDGDEELDPNDDFPLFAGKVCQDILAHPDPDTRGILICGSGQGMCMAANRFRGIRAALGYDIESAQDSRNDDNSNVLCLPASILKNDEAYRIVTVWLRTPFAEAPRFKRRLQQLDDL